MRPSRNMMLFTVGEVFNMKEDELREFVGDDGHFSSMFDFSAHELTYGEHGWYDSKPVDFKRWREILFASQKEMEGLDSRQISLKIMMSREVQAVIFRNMRRMKWAKNACYDFDSAAWNSVYLSGTGNRHDKLS